MKKIFFLFTLFTSIFAMATPARVILIRHAEKPNESSPDLSEKGYERANALANLFDLQPQLTSRGFPVALLAAKYVPGQSANRAIETLIPLSQKLNLQIQAPYLPEQDQDMARWVLNNPSFDGKTVMIAWKHSHIPTLAQALGSAPAKKWKGQTFDRIWLIDYATDGSATSKDIPQKLLPGDSN